MKAEEILTEWWKPMRWPNTQKEPLTEDLLLLISNAIQEGRKQGLEEAAEIAHEIKSTFINPLQREGEEDMAYRIELKIREALEKLK